MSGPGSPSGAACEFVTVWVGGQLFGLPILSVQDVFMPSAVTAVPLATPEVAGVLNLRGRIVTVISMRRRLGLPPADAGRPPMAIGIERAGESYGLIIDEVGDVIRPDGSSFEANPPNLDHRWAEVSAGVHRLDGRLMVVLDVDRVLALSPEARAA